MIDALALIFVIVFAIGLRFATGSWFHPSTVFASAWAIFLAAPVVLLPGIDPYPNASLFIAALVLVSALGATFRVRASEVVKHDISSSPWLTRFALAGFFTGLGAAILNLESNGRSFIQALSGDSLIASSQAMTAARYNGSLVSSPVATFLLALTYGAALVAPFAAQHSRRWLNAMILAAPSAGGAAYALLTTARAGLLIAASISLAAWMVVKGVREGGRPRVSLGQIAPLLVAGGAVAAFFLVTAANRYGGVAYVDESTLRRTVGIYAGASTPALAAWLPGDGNLGLGIYSFSGISSFFVLPGTLKDTVFTDIGAYVSSNVYTAFRPLVEDFTLPGALGLVAVASITASVCFRRSVVSGRVGPALFTSVWLSYVLFSQSASIFTFTNVVVGLIIACLLILRFATFTPAPDSARPDTDENPQRLAPVLEGGRRA